MKRNRTLLYLLTYLLALSSFAQDKTEMKLNLNDGGSHYVKGTFLNQVWLRHTQFNPGSTINGYAKDNYTDISIRRLRFQLIAQLTDRIFFYTQFGQNNFNYRSAKNVGAFFHDAVVEYAVSPAKLSMGMGLTGWSGLARYASPSIGSILTLDAPLYQQATNGVNDQFIRKLSVYAKGQLGKLDYRLALSNPMTVTGAPTSTTIPTSTNFSFSNEPPKMQMQGYVKYMFMDAESNLTPYTTGSYLGTKDIFNIGVGIIYQPDALWALDPSFETIHTDMALFGLDVFYDHPINNSSALTAYGAFTNYDFGQGYVNNIGVNNPASGISASYPGGPGNGFPAIGTGNTLYGQLGYSFGKNILTENGKLQLFSALQFSNYNAYADGIIMYESGLNYFINGTQSNKLSFGYQNRPTFQAVSGENILDTRKGMTVLQYQISF